VDWKTTVTLVVTVVVAFAGWVFAYLNAARLADKNAALDRERQQRAARLERVNRQLSELYGPLLAVSQAGTSAWRSFGHMYMRRDVTSMAEATPEELEKFRLWMQVVQMPLNERLAELVVTKADLLNGDDVPDVLLELCAHVFSYRGVIARWALNDFSRDFTALQFPGARLSAYASENYKALKVEQQELIGLMSPDPS
jgi:hypothetical protein